MLLMGKFARRSWAMDTVVCANLMRRGSGLPWAASWLQSSVELALIPLQSERRSSHDRAAIRCRSRRDQVSIVMLVLKRSPSESVGRIVALISPQRNPDRATIVVLAEPPSAVRSRSGELGSTKRTIKLVLRLPYDGDQTLQRVSPIARVRRRSRIIVGVR